MRPSLAHRPVDRYWTPAEFDRLGDIARELGFEHVRSGPLVRSSYHAGEAQ
jgi:lipoyl synthase